MKKIRAPRKLKKWFEYARFRHGKGYRRFRTPKVNWVKWKAYLDYEGNCYRFERKKHDKAGLP